MKKLLLIFLAAITLAACTKEESFSLDNTTWEYSKTENGYKEQVILSLKAKGYLHIMTGTTASYSWDNIYNYSIIDYVYDTSEGEGTILLHHENSYTSDGSAHFTFNYNKTKMHLHTPISTYTLERTK